MLLRAAQEGLCVAAWTAALTLAGLMLSAASCSASVKLPALVGDNMVLQRDAKLRIWGTADPGEEIAVAFCGQEKATAADKRGRWHVTLGPFPAGGPFEMTITGRNTITLRNILVGEVWVCSGQSNMEWPVAASLNAEQEIAAANWPQIRLFTVHKAISTFALDDCMGAWVPCSPATIGGFSAVGYFFGRELHKALGVPVGLINSSWGGTVAEAWTPEFALRADPEFQGILEWRAKAIAEGKVDQNTPTVLYNAMIEPLTDFAVRGAIWYQGESNAGNPKGYRRLLPAMIAAWRQAWRDDRLAFLIVQLANFMAVQSTPVEEGWAAIREVQWEIAETVPYCGMASAIDIGQADDIHPRNKQDVGRRLALCALARVYGRNVEYSGPTFKSMTVRNGKAVLSFTHTTGGLVVRGEELKGFAIRGEGSDWVWAKARVEGDKVVLWADGVAKPSAVRYGWANNPIGNLYNGAGLPANPFRTDAQ
ncbi:MAG: sialate O-acetylesterase [Armatimonadetes bacterium]|nr:sialate O-acetylesterase [Armatimonadota bacterium]